MGVPLVHHIGLVMTLGFTLADRLGARTVPCKVAGCTRTWVQLGGKALALGRKGGDKGATPGGDDSGAGMCEPCKTKLDTLVDKQRRCEIPGCHGTFPWTVQEQLEAFAAHKPPPRGICASCETRLEGLQDKEAACNVPGCTRTATISKRAQLIAETEAAAAAAKAAAAPAVIETPTAPPSETVEASAPEAGAGEAAAHEHAQGESLDKSGDKHGGKPRGEKPGRVTFEGPLCGPCGDVAKRLTDRPVSCGIAGCKHKWMWKADDQIQAFAAGKPNEPPRRMCDSCRAAFGKLLDREVRCRTSGCKKTWTWSRFDQLDACQAGKPAPKAPSRMCESCFDAFAKTRDIERPCRKNGCKRTWTDKRGAQLARLVRGKTGDPYPQYCSECQKELGDLAEREIPCKTEGCTGTWTWTKEQQLAAGVRPQPRQEPKGDPKVDPKTDAKVEGTGAEVVAAAALAEATPDAALVAEAHDHDHDHEHAHDHDHDHAAGAAAEGDAPGAVPVIAGPVLKVPNAQRGGGRNKDKRRRKQRQIQPPERLCHACAEFLKDKKTLEIPCSQCATPIFWPPESQLQTHLGNWASPSMCGACKRDATEAARLAAKEAIRAHAIEASAGHVVAGMGQEDAAPAPTDTGSAPAGDSPPSSEQPS
jgi:hypothetical protein